jgi:D-alanyl-D-alanine dipeptidase
MLKNKFLICLLGWFFITQESTAATLPQGFVYLQDVDPTIIQEMRYAGNHNFIGTKIDGYHAAKCILTNEAAQALAKVQAELQKSSLSLKVYDCYRPQRAVNRFISWAHDISDTKMKKEFYPRVDKTNLFKDGYISAKSGHSRGSTVDLTIVALPIAKPEIYHDGDQLRECYLPASKRFHDNSLDFGTGYDCLDILSHPANQQVGSKQKKNRLMLKSIMKKNGFRSLETEWWHYTLNNEPFSDQYFDFEIR